MGQRIIKVLVVAAVIATATSIAVGTYLRSRQQCVLLTLVPERAASNEEIREIVRILSRRAEEYGEDLGVARAHLTALEDGKINATLWVDSDPSEFIRCFARRGEMELRLIEGKGMEKTVGSEYERIPWRQQFYSLKEPGETVDRVTYLLAKKKPELRVKSFKSVAYRTEGLATLTVVTIQLHPEDAAAFNEIRRNNMGKELALVIDGEVLVSAAIAGCAESDRIEIRGIRGTTEAKRVANAMKIGALPVSLKIENTEVVK